MKIQPKVFIIPLYIIYFGLISFLASLMSDKESVQGVAIFSLLMGFSPAGLGFWLHEKLFPKQYQSLSPSEQYEVDYKRYMKSCENFEKQSIEFENLRVYGKI